jgi:2-methylisocitrate lyase-like PEP mutase family enzyme
MRAFADLILPQRKKEAEIRKFGYKYWPVLSQVRNEAKRMKAEEFKNKGFHIVSLPWCNQKFLIKKIQRKMRFFRRR